MVLDVVLHCQIVLRCPPVCSQCGILNRAARRRFVATVPAIDAVAVAVASTATVSVAAQRPRGCTILDGAGSWFRQFRDDGVEGADVGAGSAALWAAFVENRHVHHLAAAAGSYLCRQR